MAKVIPAVGEPYEVQPKNGKYFVLKEMQEIVGGYIEIIHLGNDKLMVVNEEGKLEGLPWNDEATKMYQECVRPFDYIAGNALICDEHEIR